MELNINKRLTWRRPSDGEVCPRVPKEVPNKEIMELWLPMAMEKLARYEEICEDPTLLCNGGLKRNED